MTAYLRTLLIRASLSFSFPPLKVWLHFIKRLQYCNGLVGVCRIQCNARRRQLGEDRAPDVYRGSDSSIHSCKCNLCKVDRILGWKILRGKQKWEKIDGIDFDIWKNMLALMVCTATGLCHAAPFCGINPSDPRHTNKPHIKLRLASH